jgi:hypothetical protein
MLKKVLKLIICCGLFLAFLNGCSSTPQPDNRIPKQVLNTYLEGIRDKDYTKLIKSAYPEDLAKWPQDPQKLKELLTKSQDETTGNIKSWKMEDKPFVDELNNQAIIRTDVATDKYSLVIDFDLRKQPDHWRIYGTQTIQKLKTDKPAKATVIK